MNGLANRRLQPLGHVSSKKGFLINRLQQFWLKLLSGILRPPQTVIRAICSDASLRKKHSRTSHLHRFFENECDTSVTRVTRAPKTSIRACPFSPNPPLTGGYSRVQRSLSHMGEVPSGTRRGSLVHMPCSSTDKLVETRGDTRNLAAPVA
jgi:hypothetical protein